MSIPRSAALFANRATDVLRPMLRRLGARLESTASGPLRSRCQWSQRRI
jgi:hypothetical protein